MKPAPTKDIFTTFPGGAKRHEWLLPKERGDRLAMISFAKAHIRLFLAIVISLALLSPPVDAWCAAKKTGVTVYKPGKCREGYTLFCNSYEDPGLTEDGKGEIYLIDMHGRPVHVWQVETALQSFCRLLPNGNLIYPTRDRSDIREAGIRELDPQSNVVWYYHCRIDHDFQVLDNGNFLLHCITDNMCSTLGPGLKRHPYMISITREKQVVWSWNGEQHLGELRALLPPGGWKYLQERVLGDFSFDWAHNNTCQVIPPNVTWEKEKAAGVPARFKPGNIIFSYRSLDIIGVIEPETGKTVWAWGPGKLDGQHKPHMLENGNILIFDNGTLRGYSRVIELNPLTERIEWEYTSTRKKDFLSKYISGAQRLPNGNTLVCDGSKARLFEVTPEGELVWEFVNPFYEKGALPGIYRCLRYSHEYVKPLLERIKKK
ncbi:MAG: aryl-sulfate sulfotransferase [Gemmatimonadota bacterium]|nr:aryl-sulfate sulfotransferase [Gemmatimonadota bacterium]